MMTQFLKYREQQAKAGGVAAPKGRKRTKAEALADQVGTLQNKLCKLVFPSFSEEERTMLTETLNALKNTLDKALAQAAGGGKISA